MEEVLVQNRFKYCVKDQLGRGAFGTVYSGYDLTTGEPVAVKVINYKALLRQGPEALELVNREITIL